jgi:CO/xanthine dehydrogenase FAD-binding subunit
MRLALASVAPVPLEVTDVEATLGENPITETTLEVAAQAAMAASSPIDDVRGGAEYRKYMVRNLTRQALAEVWEGLR